MSPNVELIPDQDDHETSNLTKFKFSRKNSHTNVPLFLPLRNNSLVELRKSELL